MKKMGKCEMCGKSFPIELVPDGRSLFHTSYGSFCTDWGKAPDTGCWPIALAKFEAEIRAERGLEGNIEKYWAAIDAGKGVTIAWEKLSPEQRVVVSAEHDRRAKKYRDELVPVFNVGDELAIFGDHVLYGVVCRMRCFQGPWIQDMYYVSWVSPENSGEDPQYEELLLIHRRRDYGQGYYEVEEVSIVCLKERTKMLGQKIVAINRMKVS